MTFSKKAKRHAKESKMRTERRIKGAPKYPVTVSYLPGFDPPPEPKTDLTPRTKYPFESFINGRRVVVWSDWFEYEDEP